MIGSCPACTRALPIFTCVIVPPVDVHHDRLALQACRLELFMHDQQIDTKLCGVFLASAFMMALIIDCCLVSLLVCAVHLALWLPICVIYAQPTWSKFAITTHACTALLVRLCVISLVII